METNLLVQVGSWSRPRMVHACAKHTMFQVTLGCSDCSACKARAAHVRERLSRVGTEHRFVNLDDVGLFVELAPVTQERSVATFLSEVLALPVTLLS
jgi:hypothetical protein